MIMAARRTVTGTPVDARASSTSRREERCCAEIRAGFAEPSEVDDSLHAGLASGSGEYRSEVAVLFRILRSGGGHGMNQVECRLASFEIACDGIRHPQDPFAGPPPGNPQPIRGPAASPASGRDNEWSSRNRADAERDGRQCSRWLRQSRHVVDWRSQTRCWPHNVRNTLFLDCGV